MNIVNHGLVSVNHGLVSVNHGLVSATGVHIHGQGPSDFVYLAVYALATRFLLMRHFQ
jgi:hypothetical protein